MCSEMGNAKNFCTLPFISKLTKWTSEPRENCTDNETDRNSGTEKLTDISLTSTRMIFLFV